MKRYSSSENYLSIEEMERISSCRSVKTVFYPDLFDKTFVIHAYLCDVFLGTTRRLKKVPKRSKYPRLSLRACSNRLIADNFQ